MPDDRDSGEGGMKRLNLNDLDARMGIDPFFGLGVRLLDEFIVEGDISHAYASAFPEDRALDGGGWGWKWWWAFHRFS